MKPTEHDEERANRGAENESGPAPPRSDGGRTIDTDMFTRTADVPTVSRRDRFLQVMDLFLIAPLRVAWADVRSRVGGFILIMFLLAGTAGVVIFPRPGRGDGEILQPAFQEFSFALILGTDVMGRSLTYSVIHATPAMLEMILAGAILSVAVGTFIGAVGGYKGGKIDMVFITITDTVLTIPGIVFVIVIAAIYPPEQPWLVGLLLGIDAWPGLARTVRSEVLSIREESYTEASRAMGLSKTTIIRKDVVTNLMPYISVNFANSSVGIIFASVALYFLGILPFNALNWGVMMNQAYNRINLTSTAELHWMLVPMGAITIVALGFILFAQGLDRVFNVRLRARHAKSIKDDGDSSVEEAEEVNPAHVN